MKLTQLIKANHTTFQGWCLLLRQPTLCLWCVFLNKSTFYLSLCLSLEEGNGTPLQYSCLENPMDGGAWWAGVHGVAKSQAWLSDFTFTFHFDALEKEMATHSSVLAWRIPGIGEPGGLPSMGLHRVGHDWSNLAVAVAAYPNWSADPVPSLSKYQQLFFWS